MAKCIFSSVQNCYKIQINPEAHFLLMVCTELIDRRKAKIQGKSKSLFIKWENDNFRG